MASFPRAASTGVSTLKQSWAHGKGAGTASRRMGAEGQPQQRLLVGGRVLSSGKSFKATLALAVGLGCHGAGTRGGADQGCAAHA